MDSCARAAPGDILPDGRVLIPVTHNRLSFVIAPRRREVTDLVTLELTEPLHGSAPSP